MRKILFLLILIYSFNLFAQYDDKWNQVYQLELDGNIKSAQERVGEIYKKAKRKKDETQIIKCFFYLSKFEQVFDEKAQTAIITNLQDEINTAKPVSKALLNYIYATILEKYYQEFSYQIRKLTPLEIQKSKDFLIWTSSDFEKEIEKTYASYLEDEELLRTSFLSSYKDVFDISPSVDAKNFSVYDFLSQKCIAYYQSKIKNWYYSEKRPTSKDITLLYEEPKLFLVQKFNHLKDENLKQLLKIQQQNEDYFYKNNPEKTDENYFERLQLLNEIYLDYNLFLTKTYALEKKTTNLFLKQSLRVVRVKHYQSHSFKKDEKNLYKNALTLIDTILSTKINNNALADAETAKNDILKKSVLLNLPKTAYPNQHNRAKISFKNVDSITIYYYQLPHKWNHLFENNYYRNDFKVNKDSVLADLRSKNIPLKKQVVKLPNKKDYFEYSTEFLLEKLNIGNYLIYIETANESPLDKNAFAYQRLHVTDMFIIEDDEDTKDVFYTYNRKTGKPLENITYKNEDENTKSNALGSAFFNPKKYDKDKKYSNIINIFHQNDTISSTYNRNFIYENRFDEKDDYDDFEAKAMVYFDRAIYRPGQKMYYKGILIQNLNDKKSVVPFVSIHVTIKGKNYAVLKEFDVQTNEFGSFSGEFDIPKNVLTGEFSIEIDQADTIEIDENYYDKEEEEHKFWDNVDFDSTNFNFKVEEYKRPTFEVKFDEIKENYTLGDTIKIKGNAKALAGNNLTDAKVVYSVSKHISADKYYPNQPNFITKEITTDAKGDFSIEFVATDSLVAHVDVKSLRFNINADVTDTNGETRSASQSVIVGKEMLQLDLQIGYELFVEEENSVTINASTLNNYPIDAKGTLKIYEIQKKKYLKSRLFSVPEIQGFSRAEFEQLFPHEPYDLTDYETKEVLVKTLSFDTKNSKQVRLDFLKNYRNAIFKITIEAFDANNNLIKKERGFRSKSKKYPFSDEKLFTIKDISDKKSDFYTFEIQSVIPDIYVTSRLYIDEELHKNRQTLQLNNIAIFKFPKNNDYKNRLTFHFSSVWENQGFEEQYTINKELTDNKLDIAVESFRTKIVPGSTENWSFKILNQQLEAEVLASMYDQSLDQFATSNWQNAVFYNYIDVNTPTIESRTLTQSLTIDNFKTNKNYYVFYPSKPDLKWFGFDFNNPNDEWTLKQYHKTIQSKVKTKLPKNSKFISGIVMDELGPVAGANVVVQGTNRGTTTDFDGEFQIEAAKGETLVISFIGYSTKTILIDNSKEYTISLKASEAALEEVIVVGYGIFDEQAKTAIAYGDEGGVLDDDGVYDRPNASILQTLQGQALGLNMKSSSGTPGGRNNGYIRGSNSISNNTNPLIIVDGVPITGDEFRKLNANDLENISVLKDAAATSIYGSRGANGVIIITTKNALKELTQVKTRTNFNETAFFYPNLKTDENGKISFSFTTPESLTQWKLRLFAHNKKAETGSFESSIIAQKDVMIQTNMPRFVREKDEITLTAKVVNLTTEIKSGNAMLLLFDATTMEPIDAIAKNNSNVKAFNCKSKESVPVSWTIRIPEGVQGLQYKIVAKSGNFSDGEENILPVMSNQFLLTESIPIWVKGNSKKEYVFDNLKNNNSKSLKNHLFTLEYTSNPTWLALQSLPYLMEYEHECAEQTFSRYYGNFIASEIITSNPKIAVLFESWKNNPKAVSKLTQNEELKSIVLNETPWLLDAESEEIKNKRLALLMDLKSMKESQEKTIKKIEEKQLDSGGFSWFDGGEENIFITQHIVSGFGHLSKLFPEKKSEFKNITSKAIPYLDSKYISQSTLNNDFINYYTYSNLHYLYARSFYLEEFPISKKIDSIINVQKVEFKANWINYSLYQKGLLALTMNRFGDKKFAEKIISNLKETVARNDDFGMYWIENKNGYYWYQSAIETQALLIEAFSEIEKDKKFVDEMKVWLLKQKQLKHWPTTKATSEAVYALLLQGTDWTNSMDNTKFKIGNEKVLSKKLSEKDKEATTGYIKINWKPEEISKEMGQISVENKSDVAGFGGLYWQYFEDLEAIKSDSTSALSITKNLYKKVKTSEGDKLVDINSENVKIGDLITIRLIIKTDNDLEFVHLKDLRASCFEPVDVISKYEWKDGISFYRSTKDVATHFFFDQIKTGTYVLEYDVRVNNSGVFNDGIATIQSMYAPEFSSHSTHTKVNIQK